MIKLRLLYFDHTVRRQEALEKTSMLGNVEGSRKKGRPNLKWIYSVKEATTLSLQGLNKAVNDRIFWRSLIHRVSTQRDLTIFSSFSDSA